MKNILVLAFLATYSLGQAQTCTSGLGEPIVNINFGAGPNFGPALAPGVTNLNYISSGCVLDGGYEIVNKTSDCYVPDWLSFTGDHTGDPNGYFMLIGASNQPSEFYVQTVNGLCGGTTYQFAAWILNVAGKTNLIKPNITFSIEKTDGTVLQRFSTGDIPILPAAIWQQYAFYFTTPPGVAAVVLRMTNNAPGGYGNDLAIDDITFRTAGPSVNVTMNGTVANILSFCSGQVNSVQFQSKVTSCYAGTDYQWQESSDDGNIWTDIPGAVTQGYSVSSPVAGKYLYRLKVAQTGNIGNTSCGVVSDVDTVVVVSSSSPAISIGMVSTELCAGSPANFIATTVDGGLSPSYQWKLNDLPVGTSKLEYFDNGLVDGDRISCEMKSDAVCLVNPLAISNTIVLDVLPVVNPSLTIAATATAICKDSLVYFTAVPMDGGSHPSFQWMVNGTRVGTDSIGYSARNFVDGDIVSALMLSDKPCAGPARSSNPIIMMVYERPTISLPVDTIIRGQSSIRLDPVVTGPADYYQWSPVTGLDNPYAASPVASPLWNTTYQLRVVSSFGCAAFAKETVNVFYELSMPDAFSPNGDGKNDLFRIPPSTPVRIQRFSIYNRQGAMVFATTNSSAGWDGQFNGSTQPAGTYVWVIEYENPLLRKTILEKGVVILVK